MNRIILIGNGFDLAHGLETSYRDFIDYIWDTKKMQVMRDMSKNNSDIYTYDDSARENIVKIQSPCDAGTINHFLYTMPNPPTCSYDWFKKAPTVVGKMLVNGERVPLTIEYGNAFLRAISDEAGQKNWVDIEEEYYRELNKCIEDKSGKSIERLNNEFSFITYLLKTYLKKDISANYKPPTMVRHHISSDIKLNEFNRKPANASLESILLLSFNYTSIEKQYVNTEPRISEIIHIHGELENLHDNPIIFGYGDEIGEEYRNIENKNDNRYLENIKSIKYFETDNYKRLLQFIESNEYQIFIMGHSCGNSDRVLLNMLFEHKNCLSIKIFYHKKDEYTDDFSYVVRNMSRNFTDKQLMRKIVVNKANSEPLS